MLQYIAAASEAECIADTMGNISQYFLCLCVWGVDRKRETETRTTRGEERMERRKLKVRQRETNINWEYGDSQG